MSKRERAAGFLRWSGLGLALTKRWRGVLTINYHRIGDYRDSPFDRDVWSATSEELDHQLALIKRYANVIDPRRPEQLAGGSTPLVLLTFDDGYRDNYVNAFPVLRAHGVAGIFFLTTGYLDEPRLSWWDEVAWMVRTAPKVEIPAGNFLTNPVSLDMADRTPAVRQILATTKQLPWDRVPDFLDFLAESIGSGRYVGPVNDIWMTWDMAREMKEAGMVLGGHTVNHPILARATPRQQDLEIAGCRDRIREELRQDMRYFAYPVGQTDSFDSHTRAALQEAGVERAYSFYGGFAPPSHRDLLDCPRITFPAGASDNLKRAMLTLPSVFSSP